MSYDDLIRQVNKKPFLWRCFGIFFLNGIPNALSVTSLALLFFVPNSFRCSFPNDVTTYVETDPSALNNSLKYFIPYDYLNDEYSKCLRYNRTVEDVFNFISNFTRTNESTAYTKNNKSMTTCQGNYDFGRNPQANSASMEFGYICENSWKKPLILLIYFGGKIATSLAGILSDKFGRRPTFIITTFLMFGTMFFQSFITSTWLFAAAAFLQGLSGIVNYLVGFVIGVEYTLPENRNFVSISSFVSFSLGYGFASLIGYLSPTWRWLYRIISFMGVFFIANFWFIYESPRWLLSKGKLEEAKKVFEKMAKVNNESLPLNFFEEIEKKKLCIAEEDLENKSKQSDMWKTFGKTCGKPKLFMIVAVLSYSWFSITLIYYGISLNVQSLAGNIYVNNTLMGLVEIPGLILAYIGVKYLSRPLCLGGSVIFCAICCIAAALLYEDYPGASSAAALIGKLIISGSFYLLYIHTTEIFPTLVRSTFMTLMCAVGTVGMIISPYIIYLGDIYGQYTPYLLMSILTVTSGFATLFFTPETNNVELPETSNDVMKMKILASCFCLKKKKNFTMKDKKQVISETVSLEIM